MQNNLINRYGNPNATLGYFGLKSHSQPRLVKQRQLKCQLRRKRKLFLHPCYQRIKLKLIVMATNLEYGERQKKKKEKYREKEKVSGRPAKLTGEKSDRELELEIKKKETFFVFCWKNNMKILKW